MNKGSNPINPVESCRRYFLFSFRALRVYSDGMKTLGKIGCWMGLAAVWAACAPLAVALDETNQVVNVWSDAVAGSPFITGTNITWSIDIRNNSDILPEGGPWNEDITNARLLNLYSSSQPTMGSLPLDWLGTVTTNAANSYNINFECIDSWEYLPPGQKKKFGIRTYIPTTNHVLIVGESTNAVPGPEELRGQGRFQGWGYQPRDPSEPTNPDKGGDAFMGPVGALEMGSGEGGHVETEGRYYAEGSVGRFRAVSAEGYRVEKIVVDGREEGVVGEAGEWSFEVSGVTRTSVVWAGFARLAYAVGVESRHEWFGTNELGNASGAGVYAYGSAVTVSVDRIVVDPENPGRRLRVKEIRVVE